MKQLVVNGSIRHRGLQRVRGGGAPYCAKLDHANNKRRIFSPRTTGKSYSVQSHSFWKDRRHAQYLGFTINPQTNQLIR
jgi:hypothetical protein